MKITNKHIAKSKSSSAWIRRQHDDPYVKQAQKDGHRSRAAYKIIEINDKYKFLKNGQVVVDLGAAPGSWTEYIAKTFPKSRVIAMDLLDIKPIENVEFYKGDFTTDDALEWLYGKIQMHEVHSCPLEGRDKISLSSNSEIKKSRVGENDNTPTQELLCISCQANSIPPPKGAGGAQARSVDVVLSDMAPNTIGHQKTDHLRQMTLLEYAWDFARETLKPGGTFVAKSFTGGATNDMMRELKTHFEKVVHMKPASSRKDSVEMFLVGIGFKGQ